MQNSLPSQGPGVRMARGSGHGVLRRLHSTMAPAWRVAVSSPSGRGADRRHHPAAPQQQQTQRGRWLASPVRAASHHSDQLEDLRKGVIYEAQHGFQDIQGQRERFSEFASRILHSMDCPPPASQPPAGPPTPGGQGHPAEALAPFTAQMGSYSGLGLREREALLRNLMESLKSMGVHPGQPKAATPLGSGTTPATPLPPAVPAVSRQRADSLPQPSVVRADGAVRAAQGGNGSGGRWAHCAHAAWAGSSGQSQSSEQVACQPEEHQEAPAPRQHSTREVPGDEAAPVMASNSMTDPPAIGTQEELSPLVVPPPPSVAIGLSVSAPTESTGDQARAGAVFKGEQRSSEWHKLREGRLTASAFGNALGMWSNGRVELWEEKLGLRPKFQGNAATDWGTGKEATALAAYCRLTGHSVSEECMFKVLRDDPVHSWLGASPDGIIITSDRPGTSGTPGVLEIKCPYNRGRPEQGTPYPTVPFYYMPQVQGLMAIFDLGWCDVFSWTPNGSAIYHVPRNEEYWGLMYRSLGEFWWENVVPAKHALAKGDAERAESYRPDAVHVNSARLVDWSKQLANEAVVIARV